MEESTFNRSARQNRGVPRAAGRRFTIPSGAPRLLDVRFWIGWRSSMKNPSDMRGVNAHAKCTGACQDLELVGSPCLLSLLLFPQGQSGMK